MVQSPNNDLLTTIPGRDISTTKSTTILRKKKLNKPPNLDSKAPLVEIHKSSSISQRSATTQDVDTSMNLVNEQTTNVESLTTNHG